MSSLSHLVLIARDVFVKSTGRHTDRLRQAQLKVLPTPVADRPALWTSSSTCWLLTLSALYAEQGLCNGLMSVRLCVCLSIPSIDRSSGVRRVCCWAPGGQEISIDSGGRRAPSSTTPQHWAAAADATGVTFTAAAAGWSLTLLCVNGQTLEKYPITTFCSAATAFRMLIRDNPAQYKFKTLRHCISGGEPVVSCPAVAYSLSPRDLGQSSNHNANDSYVYGHINWKYVITYKQTGNCEISTQFRSRSQQTANYSETRWYRTARRSRGTSWYNLGFARRLLLHGAYITVPTVLLSVK